MRKIIATAVICILAISVLVFSFYMPELFSKKTDVVADTYIVEADKTEYKNEYDIIEALKSEYNYANDYKIEKGTSMTRDEVAAEMKVLFYTIVNEETPYALYLRRIEPYYTDSRERIVWLITAEVSGYSDKDNVLYFTLGFDEKTKKVIYIYSDYIIKSPDDSYFYEEIYEAEYDPEESFLNEAYINTESFVSLFAKYLNLTVGEVYFDHFHQHRYTFNVELWDEKGQTVTVKVSYNLENGKYNFNY